MKKLLFTLSLVILAACSDGPTMFLPASTGMPYEVLVICEDDFWEAPAGRALYDVLDTDVPGLPQSERSFRINQTPLAGFGKLLKPMRNIIEVKIDPALYTTTKIKYTKDKYASSQIIMTIQSPDAESFREYVSSNSQKIVDFLTSAEMNRELKKLQKKHNPVFLDSIQKKFDCELLLPLDITGIKSGENFLWASDIAANKNYIQNIVVYSYPYTDESNFSLDNFILMRDSIMKVNIPGGKEGQYMTTEPEFVDIKETEFRERYMQIARGLWSMKNDMMGGPFVSHSVVDEKNGRVIVVEGFVYAPSEKKGNHIRKLEATLFTLKLPVDKDIENSVHIPEIVVEEKDSANTK